jgi:GNAT superfamily N-acetyltransferase
VRSSGSFLSRSGSVPALPHPRPTSGRQPVSSTPAQTIRLAQPADTAPVERLVHDAYLPYVARIGRPPAPMTADYRQAIEGGTVWVLDIDGQLGGILVLQQRTDHLLIENVAVDPQLQGTGAGARLLQHAEQQARGRGFSELRLYTNELMTENLAYYPRRGYVEIGRQVQDGYARVFFRRQLPSSD